MQHGKQIKRALCKMLCAIPWITTQGYFSKQWKTMIKSMFASMCSMAHMELTKFDSIGHWVKHPS
ncbi:hypothetical protein DN062_04070 [Nitrincola tibetensis]|uniref:Uncharacterized protein n=1 Tax=Nitrincola tibetensis TaxID=2219697 RepID=A0A364NQQ2_9GAMM|nr:hypothetical protein DN062_04070 [Nitrincola tibetensis]